MTTGTWADIDRMPLFGNRPQCMDNLGRADERFNACLYFGGHTPFHWEMVDVDDDRRREVLSWLRWASLAALSSISESIQEDLNELGNTRTWRGSIEYETVHSDPLLAVLFELRNFQIHYEFHEVDLRKFAPLVAYRAKPNKEPKEVDLGEAAFFAPISYFEFRKLRNIQSGRSKVNEQYIEWFNRQSETWPISMLLAEGRDRYYAQIEKFMGKS